MRRLQDKFSVNCTGHVRLYRAIVPIAHKSCIWLQGRKLLRNHADMLNNSPAKQLWQTEYDIILAKIALTRSNTNIDYTGEISVLCHPTI